MSFISRQNIYFRQWYSVFAGGLFHDGRPPYRINCTNCP